MPATWIVQAVTALAVLLTALAWRQRVNLETEAVRGAEWAVRARLARSAQRRIRQAHSCTAVQPYTARLRLTPQGPPLYSCSWRRPPPPVVSTRNRYTLFSVDVKRSRCTHQA